MPPSFLIRVRLQARTRAGVQPMASLKTTARNLPSGRDLIFLRAPASAVSHILRIKPTTKSGPRFSASSRKRAAPPAAVGAGGGRACEQTQGGGAQAVYGVKLQKILSDFEIFANFYRRQIQPFFETGFRADGHAAGLDGAGFGGV